MNTIRLSLTFNRVLVNKTIISDIIKKYNVDVNILHADININTVGRMIIDVFGDDESLDGTKSHLENIGVKYEVFNKSIIRDDDLCVHCGLCTGICPQEALYIKKDTAEVLFDSKKCIICGFCVNSCPLKIIKVEGDLFNV